MNKVENFMTYRMCFAGNIIFGFKDMFQQKACCKSCRKPNVGNGTFVTLNPFSYIVCLLL